MRAFGWLLAGAALAAAGFLPARRIGGEAPRLPSPLMVGYVEEAVDLAVDASGRVESATLVRGPKPADSLLLPVARSWSFRPATDGDERVRTHVLVALVIRAPQAFDGPTLGTPSGDLAAPSTEAPYPATFARPRYPIRSVGDGIVVVEVLVAEDGHVDRAEVLQGAGAFADEALLTARNYAFRPAVRRGKPVEAYAYLAFGFRQPVTQTPARGRG